MKRWIALVSLLLAGCGATPTVLPRPHLVAAAPAAAKSAPAATSGITSLVDEDLWHAYPCHATWASDVLPGSRLLVAAFESPDDALAGKDERQLPLMTTAKTVAFKSELLLGTDGMVYALRYDTPTSASFFLVGRFATQDLQVGDGSTVKIELLAGTTFIDHAVPGALAIAVTRAPLKVASPHLIEAP